jgi:sodium/hydrogen antiporter
LRFPWWRFSDAVAFPVTYLAILMATAGTASGWLWQWAVWDVFAPLNWTLVMLALVLILVVRPAAVAIALLGCRHLHLLERAVIAFFGIRGIGSLFYMSYGLTAASFAQAGELAALVGLVVVFSVFLHGALASPVMDGLHWWEERRAAKLAETSAGE